MEYSPTCLVRKSYERVSEVCLDQSKTLVMFIVLKVQEGGEEYPSHLPGVVLEDVLLVPEDTTHYPIYEGEGIHEWDSQFPPGKGVVRIGPQNHTFEITMFHELRCLGRIRRAIAAQSFGDAGYAQSLQECFNYLRELTLCRADVTLEDVLDEYHSVNHAYPHVCKDWSILYEEAWRFSSQS